jgi:hypothetical protein
MVTLTDLQRRNLNKELERLRLALADIGTTVQVYQFPNRYEDLTSLMQRQQTAINSLLENGELGCDVKSLRFDSGTLINKQHLENLAFVGQEAIKVQDKGEEAQQAVIDRLGFVLHNLKNTAASAAYVYDHLTEMLDTGKGSQWTR